METEQQFRERRKLEKAIDFFAEGRDGIAEAHGKVLLKAYRTQEEALDTALQTIGEMTLAEAARDENGAIPLGPSLSMEALEDKLAADIELGE